MENFDYIILGAGSAGCVLAKRLSENPSNKVLLVEAGGKDNYPWIHIPVGYFKTMHNPDVDWCYKTEPDESMNNISIRYPRGKTLGGSSSINGLLYVRGQHRDYDVWRQLGNTGWSWDDVLPYFIKAENQERGKSEFHGVGGPLSVSDQRIQLPLLNEFQNAAEEFGIPKTKDFNTGDNQEILVGDGIMFCLILLKPKIKSEVKVNFMELEDLCRCQIKEYIFLC